MILIGHSMRLSPTKLETIVLTIIIISRPLSPLCLLFLVRLGGYITNLWDFYSYRIIGTKKVHSYEVTSLSNFRGVYAVDPTHIYDTGLYPVLTGSPVEENTDSLPHVVQVRDPREHIQDVWLFQGEGLDTVDYLWEPNSRFQKTEDGSGPLLSQEEHDRNRKSTVEWSVKSFTRSKSWRVIQWNRVHEVKLRGNPGKRRQTQITVGCEGFSVFIITEKTRSTGQGRMKVSVLWETKEVTLEIIFWRDLSRKVIY